MPICPWTTKSCLPCCMIYNTSYTATQHLWNHVCHANPVTNRFWTLSIHVCHAIPVPTQFWTQIYNPNTNCNSNPNSNPNTNPSPNPNPYPSPDLQPFGGCVRTFEKQICRSHRQVSMWLNRDANANKCEHCSDNHVCLPNPNPNPNPKCEHCSDNHVCLVRKIGVGVRVRVTLQR